MSRLSFVTAGESHGPCLTTIVEGLPAGLTVDLETVNAHLRRRQGGFAARMACSDHDHVVRVLGSHSQGSPATSIQ